MLFENDVKTYGTETKTGGGKFYGKVWEWCKNVWYWNTYGWREIIDGVWEWCKNVWYWNFAMSDDSSYKFENDVKTYGTETFRLLYLHWHQFENDVKTYGTETIRLLAGLLEVFENDVKTYGTET